MSTTQIQLYLSPSELRELTGRAWPTAQTRWLRRNHWRFVIDGNGLPKVAREYWRRRMVDGDSPTELEANEPNFLAIQAAT
jgi:hypothetical protein